MTSNVTPLPGRATGLSAPRGIHLLSVMLVTLAFIVGGGAVLAAVGTLTWDVAATVEPADPPGAPDAPTGMPVHVDGRIHGGTP